MGAVDMEQATGDGSGTVELPGQRPRDLGLRRLRRFDWRRDIIYVAFIVVFLIFAMALRDYGFLTGNNLLNILRHTAMVTVMAVGMTFVIASEEIDLSVGSVAGLTSVVVAMTITSVGLVAGVVAGLAIGLTIGTINGLLVSKVRIPSFLVTLAMLGIAAGLAQWITRSAPQPILNQSFNSFFGSGSIGPVPGLAVWPLVAVAIGAVVLARTKFGRRVLATGSNETAAQYSGINTRGIKFRVLMISAMMASLAGLLYAGRLQSGRYQLGDGDELSVIAAVILGGTALSGGRGSVIGSLFGALLMGLIDNGLILAGIDPSQQKVVRGAIIILAVALGRKKD